MRELQSQNNLHHTLFFPSTSISVGMEMRLIQYKNIFKREKRRRQVYSYSCQLLLVQ